MLSLAKIVYDNLIPKRDLSDIIMDKGGMMGNKQHPAVRRETGIMSIRRIKNDIERTENLLQYHNEHVQINKRKLTKLIQMQKILETTK